MAEGLAARRCLPLLAALLHVPALHAAEMEDSSSLPASAPTALALQVPHPADASLAVIAEPHALRDTLLLLPANMRPPVRAT